MISSGATLIAYIKYLHNQLDDTAEKRKLSELKLRREEARMRYEEERRLKSYSELKPR